MPTSIQLLRGASIVLAAIFCLVRFTEMVSLATLNPSATVVTIAILLVSLKWSQSVLSPSAHGILLIVLIVALKYRIDHAFFDPESLLSKDLSGKVAIVTGASSGIGLSLSEVLLRMGATVIMACRSAKNCELAKQSFYGSTQWKSAAQTTSLRAMLRPFTKEDENRAICMVLDLADLDSVRSFAAEFKAKHLPLDYLVNNAGLTAKKGDRTNQGYETNFGVMYLGHFALVKFLEGDIVSTTGEFQQPFRIVNHASAGAMSGGYLHESLFSSSDGTGDFKGEFTDGCPSTLDNFKLLQDQKFSYKYMGPCPIAGSYSRAKFAQVLHAMQLQKRFGSRNISNTELKKHRAVVTSSLHPGLVQSGLVSASDLLVRPTWGGAVVLLHCLFSDEYEPGSYIDELLRGHTLRKVDTLSVARGWGTLPLVKYSIYGSAFQAALDGRTVEEMSSRLYEVTSKLLAKYYGIDDSNADTIGRSWTSIMDDGDSNLQ